MKDLSIVILTYNSASYIGPCLESILDLYKKELKQGRLEIIVADNASGDDTEKKAGEYISKYSEYAIKFFQNGKNVGFGNGINMGVGHAAGRYCLFLNPDAQVVGRELFKMMEYMEKNPSIKVMGGKMVDYKGKRELSAGKFLTIPRLFIWMLGLENVLRLRFSPEKIKRVDFVSGGSMMVERDYFQKIGGFDKDFFMYVEDMDLCFRVKKNGKSVCFFPGFKVRHKGQGSSSSAFAYVNIFKGIYIFHKKHSSKLSLLLVQLILVFKSIVGMVVGIVTFNTVKVLTYKKTLNFKS